jgi:hypothetical protein
MASTTKKSRGKTSMKGSPQSKLKSLPPPSGLSRRTNPPPKGNSKTMPPPAEASAGGKRKFSLRGAAPWAARHAAKQAAEAAQRMREPPRPGSARATLRTPEQADQIKERVSRLHQALGRIRVLRKNLTGGFFEMGLLLKNISEEKLYDAKGYNSFETFCEREIDLPKNTVLKLARVPDVFQESAALECGLDATLSALDAFDNAKRPKVTGRRTVSVLPMKPPRS